MKSQQLFRVLTVIAVLLFSFPAHSIDWKQFMSTPNQQGNNGFCPTYAAVHCMEGMYNYWYNLYSHLEIDMDDALGKISSGACAESAINRMKTFRLTSVPGSFPNLDHSYYSVAGAKEIPASSIYYYPHNNLLDNLKFHLDHSGPVCIAILGYSEVRTNLEGFEEGDPPIIHEGPYTNSSFHWVVAVNYDTLEVGGNDVEYIECLSSLGNNYFKIGTEHFDNWCNYPYGLTNNGRATAVYLHTKQHYTFPNYYDDHHDELNYYYSPKIYPFINKYLHGYNFQGDIVDNLKFFEEDEEIYIMADTEVNSTFKCCITGDVTDNYWPDNVTINISSQLIEPMGGYHAYYNDIIIKGKLELDECTVKPYGAGNNNGTIYVPEDGNLAINGNVTIQDLPVGIYTKSDSFNISGTDNKIHECNYGIIADQTGTGPYVNGALIEEIGGTGIRVLGATGDISCEDVAIYSSDSGAYLDTGADMELDFCTIGVDSLSFDISYDRLIQGGYGSNFTIDNCNITYDDENYHALDNNYEEVYVDGNFWGTDVQSEIYDVFSCYGLVLNWNGRASYEVANAPYPSKIAAPSPFDMARYYESIEDWRSAKDAYRQAIAQSDDAMLNKRAVKGLLHIYKEQEWSADDLRIITRNEYGEAENKHKPVFDFLYNETFVTEGDYFTAIEQFEDCADKYAGTSVEVMMLSRIANIYGDYLDDPETAIQYADRAAALNPGQPIIMSAYMSAGMLYEPSEYPDKFYHVLEYYDITDDPDSEPVAGDDIIASPNPFNPSTTIRYTLHQPSRVELSIYSLAGQKLETLVDTHQQAGSHAVAFDGGNLASGIYFYRFKTAEAVKTGKLLLMK